MIEVVDDCKRGSWHAVVVAGMIWNLRELAMGSRKSTPLNRGLVTGELPHPKHRSQID